MQKLIAENQFLEQKNEELSYELEQLKLQSMENFENLEQELAKKWDQAQQSEEELKDLQEEFLKFREDKLEKEHNYKELIENMKHEIDNLK